MILILKLLAIAMMVYGGLLILRPNILKKVIDYVSVGNRLYIANGMKIVVGIFLMLASSYCTIQWLVLFFGAIMTLGSISMFFLKKKVVSGMIEWVGSRKKKQIYIIGTIALTIGVLLILAI